MENQKEIAMLEDIKETIADVFVNENWRNLGLEKVDLYIKQSEDCKMLKILKKLRDLIEVYKLAAARELINQEIVYLKGIEKKSRFEKLIKILDNLLETYLAGFKDEYPFVLSEPQYNLTEDELEEVFYYIDHWEEIYRVREEKRLMNRLKRRICIWIRKKNKKLIKL